MIAFREAELGSYFNSSKLAVGLVDPESLAVLYANHEFARFMEQLYMSLGQNPILDWHKASAALRASCASGQMHPVEDAALGVRLEFSPVQLELEAGGTVVAVLCNAFATREQKESPYQEILDHSPHNAWACSLSGEVFWTNRTSQLHRYGREQHDLSNSDFVNKIHPDDVLMTATQFSTGMVEGRVESFRYRLLDRHGASNWFLFSAAPVKNRDGQVKYWTGTSVNIEKFVEAEAALKAEIAVLEKDNRRLRSHLQEAQTMVSKIQKMDLVAHLAGGVAHDLNNMLFVMSMYLGSLRQKLAQPELQESLTALADGIRNASRLSIQLSGFSGRIPQNAAPLSVSQTLTEARSLFQQAVGAEVELNMELAPDLCNIVVDRVYLENAIINLLINARDAMDGRGAVRIQVVQEPFPSDEGLVDHVVIAVADQGMGMDEALQARIFEPFFTTKAAGKGTGLGLSMVRNFVESSGGAVTVESRLHEGTIVKMHFPCSAMEVAAPVVLDQSLMRGQGIVMLIEDNIDVRKAVSMSLRELGYTLITATHIEQAMLLMDAGAKPDLILSDIRMPGRYTVLDLLRYLEAKMAVPVIFITGYSADVVIQEGLIEGSYPVLFKPFTLPELAQKLLEVMRKPDGGTEEA